MKPRKNKPGGKTIYDEGLKIAVARAYITGNLSFSQIAEKFKITGGREVVGGFVKWYRKHYQDELLPPNTSPPNSSQKDNSSIEQQKRVKDLEKELAQANLKIAALEIMIEIAEKELGVDIKKKPGTKQ